MTLDEDIRQRKYPCRYVRRSGFGVAQKTEKRHETLQVPISTFLNVPRLSFQPFIPVRKVVRISLLSVILDSQ